MELRDQLQAALGASYTVDRELGGGGMSRVFSATEIALGRKVVIKVVPVELGAGVNVERFKREIQLAAGLQHPHIVPVLAAGEMNGVPYYTMPFVEGEPLRTILARGPMPIAEITSLLRDVSKALAYAHERGVVHRDIKPDNVVLTAGSAAVIDFGIAKAISASRATADEDSNLTQVGTSIGTPTYMAPEQAAADPSADHRADIYSFGCMAYELLAGRPPFAGLAPQKLLAAHMGSKPTPISELRADTPPQLAALVMRCLEKDPDDRPQNGNEISHILDAVSTGETTASLPAIAFSGPGGLRRALIVWAVSFAAAYIVAKASIVAIGLPDWVLPATIVLMGLGLPLVFAISFKQQLSYKKTASRSAFGVVGFAVGIAFIMALRTMGVGPFASLMGAGKLKDKDKLLVTDFTAGGDSTLGAVVAEAVRTDLGQSPIISIVTPAAATATLALMQRDPKTRVDLAVGKEIALRSGIKAIVTGDVHPLAGGGFLVTMRLVSADSGQDLASLSASPGSSADLIPAIGKLTHQLRGKMGESLKHLQASSALAEVTTASLPALEKYTEGLRYVNVELNIDKAIPLFQEAIKLDTSFASAYRALAVAYGNSGRDRAAQISNLEHAYAHIDRLPETERYLTLGTYWASGPRPNTDSATAAYETLLKIRPTQFAALNNLSNIYGSQRKYAKAIDLLHRSIAANPSALTAYGNLMNYQLQLGNMAAAESTLNAQIKASNNNPRIVLNRVNILWNKGAYDAAIALSDSLYKLDPSSMDMQSQKLAVGKAVDVTRGQLKAAQKLTSEIAVMGVKRGFPTAVLGASIDSAMVQIWFFDDKEKALKLLEAGLKRTPLSSFPPMQRPYNGVGQIYAQAERPDLARAALADFEKISTSMTTEAAAAMRHGINATVALAEKRYLDAVKEIRADSSGSCQSCDAPGLAMLYDRAQVPDSAFAFYTRYVDSKPLQRISSDPYYLAMAYRRLGELWENKGNKAKAVEYYTKFVDLWKDADPELQPKVAEAKARLAKLTGVEGKK